MLSKIKERESGQQNKRVIQPVVDIYETEKGVIVEAELPGVRKDSLTVEALNDQLTITGTRKKAQAEGYTALYQECDSEVEYRRAFQLNSEIDQQSIKADFKAGLLRLDLTKFQETQPRKIAISS